MRSPSPSSPRDHDRALWQQLLWAVFIGFAVLATTCGHRLEVPRDAETSMDRFVIAAWRVFQAFVPVAVLLHVSRLKGSWRRWISVAMTSWWLWVLADLLVFHWIGVRLISADAWNLFSTRIPSLVPYITFGVMLRWAFAIAALIAIGWACYRGTFVLAQSLSLPNRNLNALAAMYAWSIGILLTAIPGLATWSSTRENMVEMPSRNAFGVTGCFDQISLGINTNPPMNSTASLLTANDVTRRLRGFRFNAIQETDSQPPDILVVVVESLRPELIHPSIMPNVHARAEHGLWMQSHHSGGNASSLGIFSLVNGLDAIWFYLSQVRFDPAMNRLFHQAGYELGFFGGADDWDAFQMDAFINSDAYDTFQVEPRDGLSSDQRAIHSARDFLADTQSAGTKSRSPRLAVLYLYATHSPFLVAPEHIRNLPSARADYPLPFGPDSRDAVWNRYRNSARTLDSILAPLLDDPQRLVAIVGDHGESFLDDGTIGHGTRLSAAQVRTPAIIFGGKSVSREVHFNTSHADLLPTLISLAGIRVSSPSSFDGVDLSADTLRLRTIAIADYLRPQALLLESERVDSEVFGVQCELSLRPPHVQILGPKDERGNSLASPTGTDSSRILHSYLREGFSSRLP